MINLFVDLRKYLVLAVLIVIQQGTTDLRADDGPYINLKGKVILPAGVDRLKLICELVEEKPNRPFRYEVTPIKIKDDLTFETRTTGRSYRSYRTALIVRSADKKWAASWYCDQYELLSNSSKQLELKLVPAERRAVQVTYEAQPQAGAMVFVYDEFNVEPMTTDNDGIVWIRPSGDGRKVFLAATAQDKLVAQPQEVKLPVDGSPLQLVLQKCDRAPVQVVGTDGKPVADVAISSCFIGDESRSKEPTFASFYARSDQDGVTTPLFYSEEYEILSPNMRFMSFETSSTPHRVVVAPVPSKVEVRGKIEIPSGIGEGLLLRGTSNQNNFQNQFSIFVCRVNRDGTFVAEVHPEYTYDVLVSDATWVSSTWTGVMASSKPDLAMSVSLDIVEGEQVEVLVTRGKDFEPASGVWVSFLQLQGGRRWAARTDDEGVIATRARQGKLKLYANQDDWGEGLKATVRPGETTVLKFHRNEFEPVAFTGHVSISEADASNIALSDISIDLHFVENLPVLFSDAELQVYPSNATWIKEQGLELSNDQELMLVLFDQTGNAIFRKRVQETETITSISEIIGPKQLQLVEQKWDAKSRFDRALELAQRTDRDVWASFVSIRNPASIALLRWQEENREELEKHFVLLQIDWLRDEHADAVADRFGVVKNYENRLDCVLINKEGRQLQEQQMQSTQLIDRVRIGSLLNATNKPIDPSKTKAWIDSM